MTSALFYGGTVYSPGGIEKVTTLVANHLARKGMAITLANYYYKKNLYRYHDGFPIDASVRLLNWNCWHFFCALTKLCLLVLRDKPDVIITNSEIDHFQALIATKLFSRGTKLITIYHFPVTHNYLRRPAWKKLLTHVAFFFYRYADAVVCVSHNVMLDLRKYIAITDERLHYIYNPIIEPDFFTAADEPANHSWLVDKKVPVIVSLGRLAEMKNPLLLIDAFTLLRKRMDCRLIMIGEGNLRSEIDKEIAKNNITDYVDLVGQQSVPFPYLANADCFAFSSLYEGFGNALVEALACGTPVVSTDCDFGPREILDNGEFGELVPLNDPAAFADAMERVLKGIRPPKEKLIARGCSFSADAAGEHYYATIQSLLAPKA